MRILLPVFLFACGTKNAPEEDCFLWDPGCEPPADCSARNFSIPSTRGELDGVWDADRERFVFFGGDEGTPESCIPRPEFTSEVWSFHPDCDNFERIDAGGDAPHARARHAMAIDSERNQMLVHGGRHRAGSEGNYTLFDDLWALDLETDTWSQVDTNDGPSGRVTHTMVVAGNHLLVYGGNTTTSSTSYQPSAELWSLDLGTNEWQNLSSGADAGERLFHAAAISGDGSTMYVYGGADENALLGPFFGDLWAYDVASGSWTELHDGAGTAPRARIWPDLLVDADHNRLILWAGHDDGALGNTNQVWAFDLNTNTWSLEEEGDVHQADALGFCDFPADFTDPDLSAPERRYSGAAAIGAGALITFGGKTDCGQVNDLWAWGLEDQGWFEQSSATLGEICARTFADPENCASLCF